MKKIDVMRTEGHRAPYPKRLDNKGKYRERDIVVRVTMMLQQKKKFPQNFSELDTKSPGQ